MKKQLLLIAAIFAGITACAQNKVNLVIFSEDGDPFYTYINGVRQNDKPETNVRVTGLSPNISLRIVFENKALPDLKQTMSLEPGFEHTARIKKDTKKQVKLRYFGQTPLNDEPAPGVTNVAYHTTETTVEEPATQQVNGAGSTTVTTTTTRTDASDNVSVNISMSGLNVNMTAQDPETKAVMKTTTSTTVSSSSTHSGTRPVETTESHAVATTPAKTGCKGAMSPADFSTLRKSVESKPFSDTKMSTARVATKNACLSTAQVKEICRLFSMDDDKLAYAKYAYDYCVDKSNYYQVSEVFSFSGTTDEFNAFLDK
jgi:hypothetical protein